MKRSFLVSSINLILSCFFSCLDIWWNILKTPMLLSSQIWLYYVLSAEIWNLIKSFDNFRLTVLDFPLSSWFDVCLLIEVKCSTHLTISLFFMSFKVHTLIVHAFIWFFFFFFFCSSGMCSWYKHSSMVLGIVLVEACIVNIQTRWFFTGLTASQSQSLERLEMVSL